MGIEAMRGMLNISKAAAIPANSAAIVPMLAIKRTAITKVVQRMPNFSLIKEAKPFPVTSPILAPISWVIAREKVVKNKIHKRE